jgi:hypothetical protein
MDTQPSSGCLRVGPAPGAGWDLRGLLPVACASFLAVAAGIHGTVLPEHVNESALYGAFFALLAGLQLLAAFRMLTCPTRGLVHAVAVGSALVVATWVASRTTGLPVGPERWEPEPVGVSDAAATALEIATLAAALLLTQRSAGLRHVDGRALFLSALAVTVSLDALGVAAMAAASRTESGPAPPPALGAHLVHVAVALSAGLGFALVRWWRAGHSRSGNRPGPVT